MSSDAFSATQTVTLVFLVPPKILRPNFGRGHHMTHHRAAKRAKSAGRLQAYTIPAHLRGLPIRGYSIAAYTKALWDKDNIHGACKHYLDGIAEALGQDDADWDLIAPEGRSFIERHIDRLKPRFEITLYRA